MYLFQKLYIYQPESKSREGIYEVWLNWSYDSKYQYKNKKKIKQRYYRKGLMVWFSLVDARIKLNHRLFTVLNYRAIASFTTNISEGIYKPKNVEIIQSVLVSNLKKYARA